MVKYGLKCVRSVRGDCSRFVKGHEEGPCMISELSLLAVSNHQCGEFAQFELCPHCGQIMPGDKK